MYKLFGGDLRRFSNGFAIQLNDTHPAIGVAELMRLLIDENDMDWETAWEITRNAFGYTNHTLLPEALEKWSVDLFADLFPRHMKIINEINRRFLDEVRSRFPGDEARVAKMSLIDESAGRYVRMAHLACVGSHAINGVAELHTRLLEQDVCVTSRHDAGKFSNKTNGVTPRRFMVLSNPGLEPAHFGQDWRNLDQQVGGAPAAREVRRRRRFSRGVSGKDREQEESCRADPTNAPGLKSIRHRFSICR